MINDFFHNSQINEDEIRPKIGASKFKINEIPFLRNRNYCVTIIPKHKFQKFNNIWLFFIKSENLCFQSINVKAGDFRKLLRRRTNE